jgi:predicted ester cyclase
MEDSWRGFPDLHFEQTGPICIAPDSPTVTFPWRLTGTHRGVLDPPGFAPTNRKVDVSGIDVWQLRDGRIARYWAYWDLMEIARQIGAMPPPGSLGERATVMLQRLQAAALRRR